MLGDSRGTFLALSCFPPSCQNLVSLFGYWRAVFFHGSSSSSRFSISNSDLHVSNSFILRWKYLRKSSFFFSTLDVRDNRLLLFQISECNVCKLQMTMLYYYYIQSWIQAYLGKRNLSAPNMIQTSCIKVNIRSGIIHCSI